MSVELTAELSPEDVLNQAVALTPGAALWLDFEDTAARLRFMSRLYAVRQRYAKRGEAPWVTVRISRQGETTLRLDNGAEPQRRNEYPKRVTLGTIYDA